MTGDCFRAPRERLRELADFLEPPDFRAPLREELDDLLRELLERFEDRLPADRPLDLRLEPPLLDDFDDRPPPDLRDDPRDPLDFLLELPPERDRLRDDFLLVAMLDSCCGG